MFDPGFSHCLEGPNIDRSVNALTSTFDYQRLFGEFQIYFKSRGLPLEYKIDSLKNSLPKYKAEFCSGGRIVRVCATTCS